MRRTLRWLAAAGGDATARLREGAAGVEVESTVRGIEDGVAFRLAYRLRCDVAWRTRVVELALDGGAALALHADGERVDVDITATPLTNTLPIRRLALVVGASATIRAAYVAIPSLALSFAPQRYTRLDERRWRFESLDADFRRDIVVDGDGFVVDYPGLFGRADDAPGAC